MQALIVDDSKVMRLILARMLGDLGIEVVEAADGVDALGHFDRGLHPAVVLVDWNMPRMTGIEFVQAVRRPPYSSTAPVVMVTTDAATAQVGRAIEAGADEYVMKPFTKEAIVETLQSLGLAL